MNKKAFTLIELLAVIVILGLLMAIAIPSVTRYITQSRRKTLAATINSYVEALQVQVNNRDYTFTDANTIYAVPIECIALEKGGTDPFGNWYPATYDNDTNRGGFNNYWAHVLVQYDAENFNYRYGFTFMDDAGYGLEPTEITMFSEDGSQIVSKPNLKKNPAILFSQNAVKGGFDVEKYSDNWNGFKVYKSGTTGCGVDGTETCPVTQMKVLLSSSNIASCENVK